ncbi:M20/M25/M40 family metallo-hydrolase [Candidatus Laterigemmans baculatus]|uniref:M20/M25/M40 family metallo-hydrolase n=1 Tax=Candidatus Laterigemmans baculatus TaxID=2770505 RepID=UPI001F28A410|nr:M20/M25/M40 family metallo-hydrolase [Candidatus Laterigemmans baculatus]
MLNTDEALQRVLRLMAIPGKSCEEQQIADAVVAELRAAGLPSEQITSDDAHTRTRKPGAVGNLIARLPGTGDGPTTLLSAHLDTVPICVGCEPVVDGDFVRSANSATGLGADNRAGVAAVLTAAVELLRSGRPHPPLVLCWFVQEEIGLQGSRNMDPAVLGPIDVAINFDGGTVEKLTIGATGGERMTIEVRGRAAHAGVAPENGVSAITIASLAIAELEREGWLGRIDRSEGRGTSNVGIIQGGDATNVVTPAVHLRAEARSHDSAMRERIVARFREAFTTAAAAVSSAEGHTGSIEFSSTVDYDSFRLSEDSPSVVVARDAVTAVGRTPYAEVAGGGLDANWLYRHGIEAVTLGCGQRNVHTTDEQLCIADYLDACRIALRVAAGENN